jgi:acetoin utilization protein AcuB
MRIRFVSLLASGLHVEPALRIMESAAPNRRETMRVKDIMSRPVVAIAPGASCQDALRRMHEARVRHLPVIEQQGPLVGVLTDRDLRHYLFTSGVYPQLGAIPVDALLGGVCVREVMSAPAIAIQADVDVAEAAQRMRKDRVGSLPVVDGQRVVGMLTETDLLRHVCRIDASTAPEVAEIVVSYP